MVFFVFLFYFGTVPTVTILLEQFQNKIEKQKIPYCQNSSKIK
jgi:hypothetical protein